MASGLPITDIPGVCFVPKPEFRDARGALTTLSPISPASQVNVVENPYYATLRGLHYQQPPYEQAKLISVIKGEIFDVVVDLRPGDTYRRWAGYYVTDQTPVALAVPVGCAHGYFVMREGTLVLYTVTGAYRPEAERGLRWDDPAIGIEWPGRPRILSTKDQGWPLVGAACVSIDLPSSAP